MSIISINEDVKGRDVMVSIDSGRVYTRVLDAITDDPEQSETSILDHDDCPNMFSLHPRDATCHCTKVHPVQQDDRLKWVITCNYKQREYGSTTWPGGVTDPVELPPKIYFGFVSYQAVMDKAYWYGVGVATVPNAGQIATIKTNRGKPQEIVVNSAGDRFDPPLMDDYSNHLITIVRNEKATTGFDPNNIALFKDTVNSVEETIAGISIAAFKGRMRDIKTSKMWDGSNDNEEYFEVTYEIEVSDIEWFRRVVDAGFTTSTSRLYGTHTPILDSFGQPVLEPALLDGAGAKLAAGSAVWLKYLSKFPTPWGSLALPTEYSEYAVDEDEG